MRGVFVEGTFKAKSEASVIMSLFSPQNETVCRPNSLALVRALYTFLERPEVDIPIKISPLTPLDSTNREKTKS